MEPVSINFWAVLVATLIYMALGATWYSPILFVNQWMKAIGKKAEDLRKNDKPTNYIATAAAELVACYVLAHFVQYAGATTALQGAVTGLWAWIGFVASTSLVNSIFAGRSRNLYLIDAGYHLVALVVAGMVLAAWK